MLNNTLSAFFSSLGAGEIAFLIECAVVFLLTSILLQIYVFKLPKNAKKQEAVISENPVESPVITDVRERFLPTPCRPLMLEAAIEANRPVYMYRPDEKPMPRIDVEPMFAPVAFPNILGIPEVTLEFTDKEVKVDLSPLSGKYDN